jgi:hypothetical protein
MRKLLRIFELASADRDRTTVSMGRAVSAAELDRVGATGSAAGGVVDAAKFRPSGQE